MRACMQSRLHLYQNFFQFLLDYQLIIRPTSHASLLLSVQYQNYLDKIIYIFCLQWEQRINTMERMKEDGVFLLFTMEIFGIFLE